jgi:hypothetical protein
MKLLNGPVSRSGAGGVPRGVALLVSTENGLETMEGMHCYSPGGERRGPRCAMTDRVPVVLEGRFYGSENP